MRRRGLRALLGTLCSLAVLGLGGAASADPDATYPNLPAQWGTGMTGGGSTTLSYVEPARQWIRIPDAVVVADVAIFVLPLQQERCAEVLGADRCRLKPGSHQAFPVAARVYPLERKSPATSSEFAAFPPTRVRMLAFGSIPAEATVHLSLPRDADGLPVPLVATADDDYYTVGTGPCPTCVTGRADYSQLSDSTLEGTIEVRVSDLVVDGVRVDLGDRCRATGGRLTGHGEGYFNSEPEDPTTGVPPGKYNPAKGGLLTGTVDVPAFDGCGVTEDLDALVSSMASGEGFPVRVLQSVQGGTCWSSDPAMIAPEDCSSPGEVPFPTRGR